MAIAAVQTTGVTAIGGSAPSAVSFSVLPTAGNLIVVSVSMAGDLGSEACTVTDNQGNTYIKAVDSGNFNERKTNIWYAYNIGSPSGTFTVTATALGFNQGTVTQAKEWSGFGSTDPLTGTASNGSNNSVPGSVGPSGAVIVLEALVCTVLGCGTQAFITVESVSPSWDQDAELLGGYETNSRVVTDGGQQSCSWSTSSSSPWTACLAAFAATPSTAVTRWTQAAREVLWVDEAAANLTQMARQVIYPFTCEPGPPPPPPPVPGVACPTTLDGGTGGGITGCVPSI